MKKLFAAAIAVTALAVPGSAAAQGEEHNCAGALVSTVAGPVFGEIVSTAAHFQAVDNFGLANCGAPPRQNP